MPCFHPLLASRSRSGTVRLGKQQPDSDPLHLPCGNCLGCRTAYAKGWALRCQLELHEHHSAAFSTLTYDDRYLPPTLEKRHLQLFLKRFRKRMGPTRPIRFFASGEYGEQNHRPHYHAILFGANDNDAPDIEHTWGLGYTKTVNCTTAAINYVAGYTSKKIGYRLDETERIDPDTGAIYTWQPPFVQMSRRPGIGGRARQHTQSWRLYAIQNGQKLPVPRFLHESWKKHATPEQLEHLDYEKSLIKQTHPTSPEQLAAAELIALGRQALKANARTL